MFDPKSKIRPPAAAGQFYPEGKEGLGKMIDGFLSQAEVPGIKGKIFGLLLPHAGYLFSGLVAAHGYKLISDKKFDTVILIGDSHYERFDGVSLWEKGEWETPLGKIKIDEELAKAIVAVSDRFFSRDSAHLFEHSIEVHLPFLQKALKDFKILPIIFGSEDKDWRELARILVKNIRGRKILIIASSDLSHYPSREEAERLDRETLKGVLTADPVRLKEKIAELEGKSVPGVETLMCAQDSVKTLLEIAKSLKAKAKLLDYANSGDALMGDKDRVVGYGAVAFYLP